MGKTNEIYHPVEQPDDIPIREKEDAMGGYLMMFAAMAVGLPLPIINLIAAIVYYQINKSKSRFIKFHSLQSLYSQLPTTALNAGLVYWTLNIIFSGGSFNNTSEFFTGFSTIGDLYWGYVSIVAIANLMYYVFSIMAAMKARKGQFYYFLFFGKLAYHQVYKIKDEKSANIMNEPPK